MWYSLAELGWVVFAPFLIFLHERGTLKQHLILLATLVIAFILTVSKMVSSEIPWAPVPKFAIPIAFSYLVALAVAGVAHPKLGARCDIHRK